MPRRTMKKKVRHTKGGRHGRVIKKIGKWLGRANAYVRKHKLVSKVGKIVMASMKDNPYAQKMQMGNEIAGVLGYGVKRRSLYVGRRRGSRRGGSLVPAGGSRRRI